MKIRVKFGRIAARAVQEVPQRDAAAQEEQDKGQAGALFALQKAAHPHKVPGKHRVQGQDHGQDVGKAQVRPQQKIGRGDAVAQEGIAHLHARLNGVERREDAVARDGGDEGEVHAHVPVAGLARVQGAVHGPQDVRVEQHGAEQQRRDDAEGVQLCAPRVRAKGRGPAPEDGRQRARKDEQRKAQDLAQEREPEQEGEEGRQPHLRKERKACAGRGPREVVLAGQEEPGVAKPRRKIRRKVENRKDISEKLHGEPPKKRAGGAFRPPPRKNAAKFNQEEYTIPPEKLEVGRGKCYNQCDRVVYPWDPARENRGFAFEKCMALEDRQWQIS